MNIYESISGILAEGFAVAKNDKNSQQGYKYRGIDAVMNTFQPLLARYKVFIVPEVLDQRREERTTKTGSAMIYSTLKMKYTFFAEDGTNISAVVIGEGMDTGDKASNKAMSVALKYAMFQVFMIPTEEMKEMDTDRESPEEIEPKPKRLICCSCGNELKATVGKDGKEMTPQQIAAFSKSKTGQIYCSECVKKAVNEGNRNNQEG